MSLGRMLVVVLLIFTAGCSSDEPPEVDWSEYPANVRQSVQDRVDSKDCAGLQTVFDSSDGADLLAYLDWQMKQAGCY